MKTWTGQVLCCLCKVISVLVFLDRSVAFGSVSLYLNTHFVCFVISMRERAQIISDTNGLVCQDNLFCLNRDKKQQTLINPSHQDGRKSAFHAFYVYSLMDHLYYSIAPENVISLTLKSCCITLLYNNELFIFGYEQLNRLNLTFSD